jgi:hypothetical protein
VALAASRLGVQLWAQHKKICIFIESGVGFGFALNPHKLMPRLPTPFLLASDAGAAIGGLLILLIFGVLYFLPAILGRGKRDATAIFWLNLLGGWTVLGWLAAFIWALKKRAAPVTAIRNPIPVAPAPMATRTAVVASSPMPAPVPAPRPNMVAISTAPPTVKPAAGSIANELERLFQLKEKGALTEEEYIVHKAKLLA